MRKRETSKERHNLRRFSVQLTAEARISCGKQNPRFSWQEGNHHKKSRAYLSNYGLLNTIEKPKICLRIKTLFLLESGIRREENPNNNCRGLLSFIFVSGDVCMEHIAETETRLSIWTSSGNPVKDKYNTYRR